MAKRMHPLLGEVDNGAPDREDSVSSGPKGHLIGEPAPDHTAPPSELPAGATAVRASRYCERCGGLDMHNEGCPAQAAQQAAQRSERAEATNGQLSWRQLLGRALRAVAKRLEDNDD